MTSAPITTTSLEGFDLHRRGKVRDTYRLADGSLLMVATDRVSAFDVVMPTPIPDKGRVLTRMSRWWFARTGDVVRNHLLDAGTDAPVLPAGVPQLLAERSMHVIAADRIDVECVVRGHLAGSGWAEYRDHGTLAGEPLPSGLRESSSLPAPRFTPASKNDHGHDENISRAELARLLGRASADRLEQTSLALFTCASAIAAAAGMILADTKFEFGWVDGDLVLIDELLTPDSSRFWDAPTWRDGAAQPAFDKQYLRDWLEASGWNKQPPGPELPEDVVMHTRARYLEAARRLCGLELG